VPADPAAEVLLRVVVRDSPFWVEVDQGQHQRGDQRVPESWSRWISTRSRKRIGLHHVDPAFRNRGKSLATSGFNLRTI
jgi:hypothetical protein